MGVVEDAEAARKRVYEADKRLNEAWEGRHDPGGYEALREALDEYNDAGTKLADALNRVLKAGA